MKSWYADVDGPLHVAEFGADDGFAGVGSVVVLIHSLGGSHVNWSILGEILGGGARVLCPDLPGAGLTPIAHRRVTVEAHEDLLERFLTDVVGAPAVLVGNSMGAMLALGMSARRPELVRGLALVNPWLPLLAPDPAARTDGIALRDIRGTARVMVNARRAQVPPEALVRRTLRLTCANIRRIPPETVAAAVRIAAQRCASGDDDGLLETMESLLDAAGETRHWARVIAGVAVPTLLAHGTSDRLVPAAVIAQTRALRPDWRFTELGGAGHCPQIEEPVWLAYLLRRWLEREFGPLAPRTGRTALPASDAARVPAEVAYVG